MSQLRNMQADRSKQCWPRTSKALPPHSRSEGALCFAGDFLELRPPWLQSIVFWACQKGREGERDRGSRFWLLRRYLKQQKVPMDLCFRAPLAAKREGAEPAAAAVAAQR